MQQKSECLDSESNFLSGFYAKEREVHCDDI